MSDLNNANKFELSIQIINPQSVNVTLIGINGVDNSTSGYYITCWQSEAIGRDEKAKQKLDFSSQSGETVFDGLNLDEFAYTFSLGLDYENIGDDNIYYPVSVLKPHGETEGTFTSTNSVVLPEVSSVGKNVRVKYAIPKGNGPKYYPQYIVMIKGSMDTFFSRKLDELLINNKIVSEIEDDLTLPIAERLDIGSVYTIAYIMGQTNVNDNNEPDLTKLVGWTEFVAK